MSDLPSYRTGWALEPGHARPNWVSTRTAHVERSIAPLPFSGDPKKVFERIKLFCKKRMNASIEREAYPWLHVTVQTLILRFTDDIIFFVDADKKTIEFMSASRVGYSDLDANKKRMQYFREYFK